MNIPRNTLHTVTILGIFVLCFFFADTTHASTYGITRSGNMLGLVGHWTFDGRDIVNGVMVDKSGNGNTGRFQNIATSTFYKPGKIGQAGQFDGADDYVNLGNNFGSVQQITQCTWAKMLSNVAYPIFVSNSTGTTGIGPTEIRLGGGDLLPHFLYNNEFIGGSTPVALGQWFHICGTTDTTTKRLYVNGVQVAQGALSGGNTPHLAGYIGFRQSHGVYVNGLIDDARIYSRALSAAEIFAVYNQGAGIKQGASGSISTNGTTGLNSGLVAHWTFDGSDISSGRLNDVSGNANHARPSGIATSTFYRAGKLGQAGDFDGVNDYAVVDNSSSLQIATNRITISSWIKVASHNQTYREIVRKNSGSSAWFLLLNTTNKLTLSTSGQVTEYDGGFAYPADNKWHLVTGTSDGTTINLYMDGVFQTSISASTLASDSASVAIGAITGGGSQYFRGLIDDLRIYNRDLSAAEIGQLYNQGAGIKQGASQTTQSIGATGLNNGLSVHYTFDGKNLTNGRLNDVSGNDNHANFSGIATSTFFKAGKLGQAGQFDGVDDYAVSTSNVSFSSSQPVTASLWTKVPAFVDGCSNQQLLSFGSAGAIDVGCGGVFFFYGGYGGGACHINVGNAAYANKWIHIVGTSSGGTGAGNITLYINGVYVASQDLCNASLMSAGKVVVGAANGNFDKFTPPRTLIDDVRLYSRVLSAAEVLQLYNQSK